MNDDEDTLAGDVRGGEDHCDVCDQFGPLQCHEHGDEELACARAYGEHHETIAALRAVLAMPDAWHGAPWVRMRAAMLEVIAEMEVCGG
jgi:hypothetical protein